MSDSKIKILLGTGGEENSTIQKETIACFFSGYELEPEIDVWDPSEILYGSYDIFFAMGTLSEATYPEKGLKAVLEKDIPMAGFGLRANDEDFEYVRKVLPLFYMMSAANEEFLFVSNQYMEIVGVPTEFVEQVKNFRIGDSNYHVPVSDEDFLFNAQLVFINQTFELISQIREARKMKHLGYNEKFSKGEGARENKKYYIAMWMYEQAARQITDSILDFRLGEIHNLLGHAEIARAKLDLALETDPELSKRIMKKETHSYNFVYDKSKFQNAFVENCPICGRPGVFYSTVLTIDIANYSADFDPVRSWKFCPSCKHGFAHNVPANLEQMLKGEYSIFSDYRPNPQMHIITNSFSPVLEKVRQYTKGNRLLDVGVGQGELAFAAKEHGFEYLGVEISMWRAFGLQKSLGRRIVWADFLKFNPDGKFDVLILGDVIEHVLDPCKFIEKAAEVLNPGGCVWLSTPNLTGCYATIMRRDDVMPKENWHLNYFTKESLELMMEKYGMDILEFSISKRYNGSMEVLFRKKM